MVVQTTLQKKDRRFRLKARPSRVHIAKSSSTWFYIPRPMKAVVIMRPGFLPFAAPLTTKFKLFPDTSFALDGTICNPSRAAVTAIAVGPLEFTQPRPVSE